MNGRLLIGPIDLDFGRDVLSACEPAKKNFEPTPQFGARYAFVRRIPALELDEHPYDWDKDGLISKALALSRWIRPTGWGLDYAARVIPDGPGGEVQIIPVSSTNLSPYAFVPPHLAQDRLTQEGAQALRRLLRAFLVREGTLPSRIKRAMWNYEFVSRTYFVNVAWHLVCASFEAIVNTGDTAVSKQYRERVAALAAAVSEPSMTESRAKQIYSDIRCDLAHGGDGTSLTEAQNCDHFVASMTVLRKVLRKCAEDRSFATNFKDDESVRRWRPVWYERGGGRTYV